MVNTDRSAQSSAPCFAYAPSAFRARRFRSLCLAGIAGTTLLAGPNGAFAEPVVWSGGGGSDKSWNSAANWQSGAVPTATSAVTIDTGLGKSAVTTNIAGAAVAASLDIGKDGSAAKAIKVTTTLAGTLNVGALHLRSGGWLQVTNTTLPADAAGLTVGTLTIDDKAILDIDVGNVVDITSGLVLAGTAQGPGTLVSAGSIVQTDGRMGVNQVRTATYEMSGGKTATTTIGFSTSFALSGTGAVSDVGTRLVGGAGSTMTQSGGTMGGIVTGIASYTQSAGVMGVLSDGFINGKVTTQTYTLSGGSINAAVDFSTLFAMSGAGTVDATAVLKGSAGSAMTQSGGSMAGTVTGVDSYAQSGGSLAGKVTTETYALTDAAATSQGAVITASESFDLAPATGTATVAAKLSGTGDLVKSGDSIVLLTNQGNDFTGAVAIDAGTLEVLDNALPDYTAVTIAEGATLAMNTASNTTFMGTMDGDSGELVKKGTATLTLGGDVTLGGLNVEGGTVQVGTGTSENTVSFDYAVVDQGATLYVASGATLTIRIPNNLVNNGTFINDGIVNDDLDNSGPFVNNAEYNAKVLSNTGTIDNTADGVWTGDILTNAGTITNSAGGEWKGDVLGNTGVVANKSGADWLGDVSNSGEVRNAGTWTGDVVANATGKSVANQGGAWTGDVTQGNHGTVWNTGVGSTWTGDVTGNSGYIQNAYSGVWIGDVIDNSAYLNNYHSGVWTGDVYANTSKIGMDGTWTGKVYGNAGIIDATESWTGAVVANSGTIWNHDQGYWYGDVEGNSGLIDNDNGNWTGDVANSGTIRNNATAVWTGDVLANAGTITTAGIWNGDFTSAGIVNAQGQINGSFTNSGVFTVTGPLTGITALTNTGTTSLLGGGAGQTFTVASASFGTGSFFDVDVDATGASDQLIVTGTATLAGTVRVTAGTTNGPYDESTVYTVLSAGSVSGAFDAVTTDLAFFSPKLSYDNNAVELMFKRNDVNFAEVGVTANQKAAAGGAYSLGTGNPIFDALLWLTRDQAPAAFDALSGEAYGSFGSVSVQDAVVIADLVTSRVDRAFDTDGGKAGSSIVTSYDEAPELASDPGRDSGLWGQLYGAHGRLEGDAAISGVESTMGGVAGGLDGLLGDWRLGAMLHAGRSSADVDDLGTSSDSTDYGAGVYGGRQWGATRLAIGAAYTRHDVDASRSVSFPGLDEDLSADYASGTAQAFGKLSHVFSVGAASLIPYASLAYVSHDTDGFRETGGDAALDVQSERLDATFATLGLGSDRSFLVGDRLLTAKAALGWRHAFSDAPVSSRAFAGGDSFDIVGASLAGDMIVVNAGLNFAVGAASTLDVTYDGQIGSDAQTHALRGAWATRF